MEDLQIGDVVKLKSDGPKMTISNIGDYSASGGGKEGARCDWFDGKEKKNGVFNISTLKKA